jgi:uncharacterized phage-like protein YoqJ
MIVAITGHRPNKLGNEWNIDGPISEKIKKALKRVLSNVEPTRMISGMALGVDTIWALLALEKGIPLTAAIPCKNHSSKWTKSNQDVYNSILTNPLTTVHIVSDEEYNDTCMQNRNIFMVDNSDLLVAVWNETAGGTANCVNYAKKQNKRILPINPDKLV